MMSHQEVPQHRASLVRNTFYSGLTTSAGLLLFVLMILAGRSLGSHDFGVFSFALSLASIFAIITDFGLDDLVVREVARDRGLAGEYFGKIFVWKLILSVVALAALVITVNALKSSPIIRMVTYLLGSMAIFRSFITTVRAFFRAFERFDLETLLVVTDRVLLFTCGAAFLLTGGHVVLLAVVFSAVRLISVLIALTLFHRRVDRIVPRLDIHFIRAFQIQALPFGLAFLCFGLYTYIDKIVLSLARSDSEVGLYNAGFQLYEGLMIIPVILAAVFYPRLSTLFLSDRGRHRDLFLRGAKYLMMIAFPLAAGGLFLAGDLLSLLFGAEFLPAAPALSILLCAIVLAFQNVLLHTFLNSMDRQRTMLLTTLLGFAMAVLLDILLIPRYGIVGAAAATLGYVATIFLACGWSVRRSIDGPALAATTGKVAAAAVLAGLLLWRLEAAPVVLAAAAAAAVYLLALLGLRVLDRTEVDILRQHLRRIFSRA
jgi:O-antigen/teichoic acid export membrane protein